MSRVIKTPWLKGALLTSLLLTCFLASASASFGSEREWQPQRTWVFIVGTLKWNDSATFKPFPQLNRRDAQLADFFRREGVPAHQLVYLQDEQATIRRVRTAFSEMLARTKEGDFLFVYFTGHGYKSEDERITYFATYDASESVPGWSTASIVTDINWKFRGARVLLTADCCYSGELAKDARRLNKRLSYACLTSASASEVSTENWTFTEMLLGGLRGKAYADIDRNGEVTLGEISENAKRDMAFAEDQEASFASNGFPAETILANAQTPTNPAIGRRVVVSSEGDWYKARIIDARGNRLRVHYFGYEDSDDEWVLPRQLRGERVAGDGFGSADEWRLGKQYSEWQTSQ